VASSDSNNTTHQPDATTPKELMLAVEAALAKERARKALLAEINRDQSESGAPRRSPKPVGHAASLAGVKASRQIDQAIDLLVDLK
jgi:hypothetical protein